MTPEEQAVIDAAKERVTDGTTYNVVWGAAEALIESEKPKTHERWGVLWEDGLLGPRESESHARSDAARHPDRKLVRIVATEVPE